MKFNVQSAAENQVGKQLSIFVAVALRSKTRKIASR
jgi:hypothetical protein